MPITRTAHILLCAFFAAVTFAAPGQALHHHHHHHADDALANSGVSDSAQSTEPTSLPQLEHAGIPRFAEVSPNLFRGGQPSDKGLLNLKEAGVKTIINLRNGGESVFHEASVARDLGLKFVSIPMNGIDAPSQEKIK